MPLIIEDKILTHLPKSTLEIYEKYPSLKESATRLLSNPLPKVIGPIGSLNVLQREFAVVSPLDKCVSIVGSTDATTCCIMILREWNTGIVALAHLDGSDLDQGVESIMRKVHDVTPTLMDAAPRFHLHIIGGFMDSDNYSQQLVLRLIEIFEKQIVNIHLVTFCVCEYNNVLRGSTNWPISYGVAFDVKTGEMMVNPTFVDCGPETALRSTRVFGGCQSLFDIYDTINGVIKIVPFNYKPMRGLELWLSQSDDFIRQNLSTSPEVEPPHFVAEVRKALSFIKAHPFPGITVFPNNKGHYFRKDMDGSWVPVFFE